MQKDLTQEKQEQKVSSIIKKLGLSETVLGYRTPFEKSPYPCVENILRGSIKAFITSFGIKASFSLVLALLKYKKWLKDPTLLLKAAFSKDNVLMGCFIGSFTLVLKFVIFLCRIIRKKDDGWNGFIAGFSAGYLSMFFSKKQVRVFLACLLLSRAYDCCYNHLINKGTIKKSKYHYVWVFALLNSVTGYAYAHEEYLLSPAMVKFGDKMCNQSSNELIARRLYHEITRRELQNAKIIKDLIF